MQKVWHVKVNDDVVGPFTPLELARIEEVTVRSFVWREGFEKWKRIEEVQELVPFFKKPKKKSKRPDFTFPVETDDGVLDEEIVLGSAGPPQFPFFIILVFLLLSLLLWIFWFVL